MNSEMTQSQIEELLGAKSYISKHSVKRVWNNLMQLIISELQNIGKIRFENFGTFEVVRMGGKDEYVMNELGAMEKRYVDFYLGVKFTPSNNFIKFLNSDKVREKWSLRGIVTGDDLARGVVRNKNDDRLRLKVDEDMRFKIKELAEKNNKKSDKPKKEIANNWSIKIKCLDNDKIYESIYSCARELNLNYQNLNNCHHRNLKNDIQIFEFCGYKFEIIKNKKIGEK